MWENNKRKNKGQGIKNTLNGSFFQDAVILVFILFSYYIFNPFYKIEGYSLLIIQASITTSAVIILFVLRKIPLSIITNFKPFILEIFSFSIMFAIIIFCSFGIPYIFYDTAVNSDALYFGVMGSLLYGLIYFLRVYPSFIPKNKDSLKHLINFTLEILKLGITIFYLFFLIAGAYLILKDDAGIEKHEMIMLFTAMLATVICGLGFLTMKYFELVSRLDYQEGQGKTEG